MISKLYPSPLLRYLVAVVAVAMALGIRLMLTPIIGHHGPFLVFIVPVTLAAWYGGIGPGLLATLLSAACVDYFFMAPIHSFLAFTLNGKVRMSLFGLEATVVSAVVGALRNAIYRAKAELALQESEEQLRLLIESLEDYAIMMLDLDGFIVTWNSGAERIMGYRSGEIIGRHVSTFYTAAEAALAEPEGTLQQAAAKDRWKGEQLRVRKDGTQFRARVVVTALKGRGGDLRGFAEIVREAEASDTAIEDERSLPEGDHHEI